MNNILKNIYLAYLSYQLTTYAVFSVPIVKEEPIDILLDGLAIHTDEEGCCETCAYSYCPSLDDCIRPWETYCKEFDFPYDILYEKNRQKKD